MSEKSREFQIFAKPVGASCNLGCSYCYYLEKEQLYAGVGTLQMSDELRELYIQQHIDASTEKTINFSWHGGEPTLAGLDFFLKATVLQKKYKPEDRVIINGIQTNGTLLDDEWCTFLSANKFLVGISMDGPAELHNRHRVAKNGKPFFEKVLRGYELLQRHNIVTEILCVVNADNSKDPLRVYRFFKGLGARYITFLPLVEQIPGTNGQVSDSSVVPEDFGNFMTSIFNEWVEHDIGNIKVQLFEEAARTAFKQEHTLCIFKKTCGGVPVVEFNGDFYSCDHYVDPEHHLGNIGNIPLAELLDADAQTAFGKAKQVSLPQYCLQCEVLDMCNGECPKNRFITTPDGEPGLNYLCGGYRKFFNHCRPFVESIAAVWENRRFQTRKDKEDGMSFKREYGRNDLCPCGSGKKYKNCCMR